jgi:hypothetical protein
MFSPAIIVRLLIIGLELNVSSFSSDAYSVPKCYIILKGIQFQKNIKNKTPDFDGKRQIFSD